MKELNRYGTFSNMNSVICSIEKVLNGEEEPFYVNWKSGRDWDLVFEQPFNKEYDKDSKDIPFYIGGCIAPMSSSIMYLPIERDKLSKLIKEYIRPKPHILERVQKELDKFPKDTLKIGVHIRGAGHFYEGSTKIYKHAFKMKDGLHIDEYVKQIKKKDHDRIYVATDTEVSIKHFKKEFSEERIVYQKCKRTPGNFGEIHHNIEKYNVTEQELFEDVVVDVLVLSKMDYIIFCNSNISNFVLASNPTLEYHYLFDELSKKAEKCFKAKLDTSIKIFYDINGGSTRIPDNSGIDSSTTSL